MGIVCDLLCKTKIDICVCLYVHGIIQEENTRLILITSCWGRDIERLGCRSPADYSPQGHKESDMTEVTQHAREPFFTVYLFVGLATLQWVNLARQNDISQNLFSSTFQFSRSPKRLLCELWRVAVKQKLFGSSIYCCLSAGCPRRRGAAALLSVNHFPLGSFFSLSDF